MQPSVEHKSSDSARAGACPACGGREVRSFFEMPSMPVVCNALFRTREEALAVERGDLRIAYCGSCAFIYNLGFDPRRVPYGAGYENSLYFSAAYREFADRLAQRLVERYAARGERVVEIACGNAEFLSRICAMAGCEGIGFDPSYVASRAPTPPDARVEVRSAHYSEADTRIPADLICCRHALEHLDDPLGFLRMLRRGLGEGSDAALYFEVPNGTWILEEFDLWDLIYEHFAYFCGESLVHLFQSAGFEVLDAGDAFDRQFLWVEARVGAREAPVRPDVREMNRRVERFAAICSERVTRWQRELVALAKDGRRVAVWGAGSKGVTFLNLFRESPALTGAVDVNPHKAGMFVSGTGHLITAPEQLGAKEAPDVFVVMNPVYLDEIRDQLRELGIPAECRSA